MPCTVTIKTPTGSIQQLRNIDIVDIDGVPFADYFNQAIPPQIEELISRVRVLEIVVSKINESSFEPTSPKIEES